MQMLLNCGNIFHIDCLEFLGLSAQWLLCDIVNHLTAVWIISMWCVHENESSHYCLDVDTFVCLSGMGVHCDHTVHFGAEFSNWPISGWLSGANYWPVPYRCISSKILFKIHWMMGTTTPAALQGLMWIKQWCRDSSSVEAPACKTRRMTSVVVEQPASDKILLDSVPDASVSVDNVRHYVLTTVIVLMC